MTPLIDQVQQQLDPTTLSQLSRQLGISEDKTRQAVPLALTTLLGGLARNSADPAGAQQLAGALERDHDGSILDNLGSLLGGGLLGGLGGGGMLGGGQPASGLPSGVPSKALNSDGILGHIFGGRRPAVESNVGRATGLDGATVGRLLMLLAPIVLGVLGRRKRQQGLDPGGLSDVLGQEHRHLERAAPGGLGGLGGLLDADGDGKIVDDLAGMVGGFLGNRPR